jgi:hypothetical protein
MCVISSSRVHVDRGERSPFYRDPAAKASRGRAGSESSGVPWRRLALLFDTDRKRP